MLEGECSKCGVTVSLVMHGKTREEMIETLKKMQGFECPGHHVELGSPYPTYWNIDEWEEVPDPPEEELTDEVFIQRLKDSGAKEILHFKDWNEKIECTGFSFGLPITTDEHDWHFSTSPNGIRYYYYY